MSVTADEYWREAVDAIHSTGDMAADTYERLRDVEYEIEYFDSSDDASRALSRRLQRYRTAVQ